jgi:peptide/nickel transport system permease protein
MARYLIRRILQAIPLLFFISLLLFVLLQNMGDPLATLGGRQPTRAADRERLARQLGLDEPVYMQYLYWLIGNDWKMIDVDGDGVGETAGKRQGILRGDFGTSLVARGRTVTEIIWERIPNTLLLMLPAEFITITIALFIGVYSALHQYSKTDNLVTTFSFLGLSVPIFFVALMMVYIFAVLFKRWGLPYFPPNGMFDPKAGKTAVQILWHMGLPLFTLVLVGLAGYSRYIRSTMLEVISQDYIRTARAKGLTRPYILYIHALKNAALPVVTLVGLNLPFVLAGAVVTESIFAWPGMGRLFLDHLERKDTPVVMGILLLVAVAVIVFQILTDLVYAWLDPRIRYD